MKLTNGREATRDHARLDGFKRGNRKQRRPSVERFLILPGAFSRPACRLPIIEDFVLSTPNFMAIPVMRAGWLPQKRLARWGVTLLRTPSAFVLEARDYFLRLPGRWHRASLVVSTAILAIVFSGSRVRWVRQRMLGRLRNRLIVTTCLSAYSGGFC